MNDRFKTLYMDFASRVAQMSRAVRLQVGCVIVKDNVVVYGYNGTPSGWDNECETKEWCSAGGWLDPEEIKTGWPYEGTYLDTDGNVMQGRYRLKSKPEVLHAERNAISKLAKSPITGQGASMFLTHSPCLECAKSIEGSGITEVFYLNDYRDSDGVYFLRKCNIMVTKL